MFMRWEHLCFMHWRVDAALLRPHVPPALALDEFDGSAWLGVVPFVMSGVRHWRLPAVPGLSRFPELNVRTYVRDRREGKHGVWFFTLDAHHRIAVRVARRFFALNYQDAAMRARVDAQGWVWFESRRVHRGALPAALRVRYRPTGPVRLAARGTLEEFLTERYCLYAHRPAGAGTLLRGDIHHEPWPLQPAEAIVDECTMAQGAGLPAVSGPPLCHYAARLEVPAWWPGVVAV